MEAAEDDLTALRSAALASLSSKAEAIGSRRDEEDLDALRKAALMTRKQNQIQVIQRPSTPLPRATIQAIPAVPVPITPPLRNIPPPPLLIPPPPPIRSMSIPPPPIFSRSIMLRPSAPVWTGNNLISLTPGHAAGPRPVNFLPRPHTNIRPLMPVRVSPLPIHRVPNVVSITQNKPVAKNAVVKTIDLKETTEQKVPDKFSRYDPDSSSEDDDEHPSAKKNEGDASDAESVASKKSFSSVSDVNNESIDISANIEEERPTENMESGKVDRDADSDPGTPVQDEPCDDDISIGDDEGDDILAAIDDFLEDRPEKAVPKKVIRKNSDKQEAPPIKKTPIAFERTTTSKQIVTKKSHPNGSQSLSNSSKQEINKPVKVKKTETTSESRAPTSAVKQTPQESKGDVSRKTKDALQAGNASRIRTPVPEIGFKKEYTIPVVNKHKAPSPQRHRRDSDLDSVGTSDLSFLSSDEDKDQKRELRKRPRTRSISDGMEKRRNERLKRESRVPDAVPTNKGNTHGQMRRQAPDRQLGSDLRKKLESKGVKRPKMMREDSAPQSGKERKSRLNDKIDIKRGVISLKPKRSAISSQPKRRDSNSTTGEIIVVTASAKAGTRAIRSTIAEHSKSKVTTAISRQTPQKRSSNVQSSKRIKLSQISPIVAPSNTRVVVQPPAKKTTRKNSNDKIILRKASTSSREPARKIDDVPRRESVSDEENFSGESGIEGDKDGFFVEEIFSFDNQDVADYDDVLGFITDEVEVTPKATVRSTTKASKGRTYESAEANTSTRSVVGKIQRQTEPKARSGEKVGGSKVPIHQRLGRQLRQRTDSDRVDDSFDTVKPADTTRRILVSRSLPPRDNDERHAGTVQNRLGKSANSPSKDEHGDSSKPRRLIKGSVRRISKKVFKSPNTESMLEKKIRRIKQQNGKILKRQMEIEREKEKFG